MTVLDEHTTLDAALELAAEGFRVLPCHATLSGRCSCGRGDCDSPAKRPRTPRGCKDATRDPGRIMDWWRQWPDANVAVATGDGLLVVDIDGADAQAALDAQVREYGGLPMTRAVLTGRDNGRHLWLHIAAGVELGNSSGRLAQGVDTRGAGGYAMAPPSVHATGRRYEWETPGATVAPAPAWLVARLTGPRQASTNGHGGPTRNWPESPTDETWRRRIQALGNAALADATAKLDAHPTELGTGRGTALYAAAARLGRIVASDGHDLQTTWQALETAGHRLGLCEDELQRSVERGLAEGLADPLTRDDLPDRAWGSERNTTTNGMRPAGAIPAETGWPAPLKPPAVGGLAGEVVATIGPHSEADPAALLLQYLVAFGNAAGRSAGFRAEADFHATNLYLILVGQTAKGRKGSSWGQIARISEQADPEWRKERVTSGASSGEGLIWAVRDPIVGLVPHKEKGKIVEHEEQVTDPGVADKRLLDLESEFASVLRVMRRESSTLSVTIRHAWDDGNLQTLTKNNPVRARGAHISIIGHITCEELRRELDATEAANGFANRFLFACVKRSKALPEGGNLGDREVEKLAEQTKTALRFASTVTEMRRDQGARAIWADVYEPLSDGKPGLFGAVTSRAEAQVMRLACVYALLDLRDTVSAEHLQAGLAVWNYCDQSARHVFGSSLGDPFADAVLQALRGAPARELTRTELRDRFSRHKNATEMERALELLERAGLAAQDSRRGTGRSPETWRAT